MEDDVLCQTHMEWMCDCWNTRPHGARTGETLSAPRLLWPVLSESGISISSARPAPLRLWLSWSGCFWLRLNHRSKWGVHLRERLHHLDKITAPSLVSSRASAVWGYFLCFFYSRTNKTQCSCIGLVSVTLWALEATQAPSLGRNNPQVSTSSLLFASFILR